MTQIQRANAKGSLVKQQWKGETFKVNSDTVIGVRLVRPRAGSAAFYAYQPLRMHA